MRVYLPYAAAILAALVFGTPLSSNFSYWMGELAAHLVALGVILAAGVAVAKRGVPKTVYLPWIAAVVSAAFVGHVAVTLSEQHAEYPATVRASFLAGCENAGMPASYCGCSLRWFESHKSLTEFAAYFKQVSADAPNRWDPPGGGGCW